MKILVDTSSLYSAFAYPGRVAILLEIVIEEHTIVLSDLIVEELKRNLSNKLEGHEKNYALSRLELFISRCQVKFKDEYEIYLPEARSLISEKDAPILACAMLPDIDVLLVSDKEFWSLKTEKVTIVKPGDLLRQLI